ncbi:unnamed protein product [marine sediment metagenome]|uniref:Uncharacterized protein n=1 Tax=marine sediment metagenome TaxID=412755 RepID=X0U5Q8_9ZZZZ
MKERSWKFLILTFDSKKSRFSNRYVSTLGIELSQKCYFPLVTWFTKKEGKK